ncbi:MAG: autoinducer binding domain-containing protein [Pseudomonadota bacterium]
MAEPLDELPATPEPNDDNTPQSDDVRHERALDGNVSTACAALADNLAEVVFQLRDRLGVKHLVYHAARHLTKPVDDPFIRLTYPADWVHRYLTQNYMQIDPVIREGFTRTLPFNWGEVGPANDCEQAFFRDAASHNIGNNGYSIPLRDKTGRRALFSVSSDDTPDRWAERCLTNKRLWLAVGNFLHQRAMLELGNETETPRLTPREREVLYWTAQGKTAADIGLILGLTTYTVSTYLRSARFKTNSVSITQAVYKAQQLGIIQDPAQR